eukprot:scaffold81389_cov30-Tisochrysis_lutea.AAC.6
MLLPLVAHAVEASPVPRRSASSRSDARTRSGSMNLARQRHGKRVRQHGQKWPVHSANSATPGPEPSTGRTIFGSVGQVVHLPPVSACGKSTRLPALTPAVQVLGRQSQMEPSAAAAVDERVAVCSAAASLREVWSRMSHRERKPAARNGACAGEQSASLVVGGPLSTHLTPLLLPASKTKPPQPTNGGLPLASPDASSACRARLRGAPT